MSDGRTGSRWADGCRRGWLNLASFEIDSGLLGLAMRDELTLDELDEIGAVVCAVTDDAGLWVECERAGLLGASRFDSAAVK